LNHKKFLNNKIFLHGVHMKITKKDVEHVATLARLRFKEDEVNLFAQQLNDILEYFEKLRNINTTNVNPSTHAVNLTNAFREDNVKSSLPSDESLKNAPDSEQTYFKVPKIIEV
jgi:aspartyl-tRNA(Asn)/glutamyl-tRNA(Gln) amidotransferase subunit C